LPSTCQALAKHLPSTCQALAKHLSSTSSRLAKNLPRILANRLATSSLNGRPRDLAFPWDPKSGAERSQGRILQDLRFPWDPNTGVQGSMEGADRTMGPMGPRLRDRVAIKLYPAFWPASCLAGLKEIIPTGYPKQRSVLNSGFWSRIQKIVLFFSN